MVVLNQKKYDLLSFNEDPAYGNLGGVHDYFTKFISLKCKKNFVPTNIFGVKEHSIWPTKENLEESRYWLKEAY